MSPRRRIPIVGLIAHAPVDVVADAEEALLADYGLAKLQCTTIPYPRSEELGRALGAGARFLPGGCGANMAAGLAALGSEVAVVAPFGADSHGSFARADLESRGVEIRGFGYDGPHSLVYTLITGDRERTFADYCHGVPYDLAAAAHGLDDQRIVAIDGYLLLRLGVADGIRGWLASGRPEGQDLVFCPGDVSVLTDAGPIVRDLLAEARHLVLNRHEAAKLFPGLSDEAIAAMLRERGVSGAITQGEAGAFLFDRTGSLHVGANKLDRPIVNTNGAGDAFTAGYLHGIEQGLPLDEVARLATACAARVLTIEGARPERAAEVVG
ncbi:carbohydrate kinase family protein [Sphingomonas sp.]|uniref:carbohydrate kinase family protein n=1 Tax=Sphingomonas sp. TaxID=28214 RepID=UPI001B02F4C0|nr:carbohydrate kinase family protein [Sphingomonas sp.]MBO9713600.1 carbohydrate kinase family protein [Sphingomonas sp.]